MENLGRASKLVRELARREGYSHGSSVTGFNSGPKKNGFLLTLHFENGTSASYSEQELWTANGLTGLSPFDNSEVLVEWLSPTEFVSRNRGRFGRNTLYSWLAENKLPHVQIGRKILIPSDAFNRMLSGQNKEREATNG